MLSCLSIIIFIDTRIVALFFMLASAILCLYKKYVVVCIGAWGVIRLVIQKAKKKTRVPS
jgi:hypothetical protein